MVVAQCDAEYDMTHYAVVYLQDGPIEIHKKVNGRWKRFVSIGKEGKLA